MLNPLQQAGALGEPTNFAPLHTNRIFTGLWTNRSLLRDAATTDYQEAFGMGRQDSILGGFNSEISPRLTLFRRPGSTVYNGNTLPTVTRFYSFNTFTLTSEVIRVMADTYNAVLDITGGTVNTIFQKSPGAGSTYFLGVGNTLYMTNGVDNVQWVYDPTAGTGVILPWGVNAPTVAPTTSQTPRPNPYASWAANTGFCFLGPLGFQLPIIDPNNNIQVWDGTPYQVQTGPNIPPIWNSVGTNPTTPDGSVIWRFSGSVWQPNSGSYIYGSFVIAQVVTVGGPQIMMFVNVSSQLGDSGPTPPNWNSAIGSLTPDNVKVWQNLGVALTWNSLGPLCTLLGTDTIVDPSGYLEHIISPGRTSAGPAPPTFGTLTGAYTTDGSATWINAGPFAIATFAPVQYGYAVEASATVDISNMSPPSLPVTIIQGNQLTIQGTGTAQGDTIVLYSTAPGGSTFMQLATFPNPGNGIIWTYIDPNPGYGQNFELQAQRNGEGTPLPAGATCLAYHLTRIAAAVGNVAWISSGPDAIVAGSSGNAGFDTQLVAQSKIIRFWPCSLGLVVFTVRDAYIILGSATDTDPLYMVVFIEGLPLRSYDCFTVNKTTPYLLMGNNQLVSLDPSAGIIDVGYPIADRLLEEYDPSNSYLTFHSQSSLDTALYVANNAGQWYRMAANNAPEQGSAWSTKAQLAGLTMGCVQSVEVNPGVFNLLIAGTTPGPVWLRDRTVNTDAGNKFAVNTQLGNIVLALPGQLAVLYFITLESVKTGTRAGLALLLGELSGQFEALGRTRQDPTLLPPSNTIYSDRYHFMQNQKEAWCRYFQMQISWPAEDAANELLTFTIFGQTWQEMRSQ